MTKKTISSGEPAQINKFREAARDLECDDDEARFDGRLSKLVKKPAKRDGQK